MSTKTYHDADDDYYDKANDYSYENQYGEDEADSDDECDEPDAPTISDREGEDARQYQIYTELK